ncbi:MAG: tRNA glutamyl-Q(34) synthetase GluQRS, partial [Xanthomonadales bacterium]|nr:tRNA glutamyl-Q(34) synthetase GluQRS [Xanthomonadales bacterium]
FAPSPTGPLHFGSLVAALASWLDARAAGGRWLVRIEDVDRARTVEGAEARILASLRAHGLEADEPVIRQSERGATYADALARLRDAGHAYPCACSRSDLAGFDGIHPDHCLQPCAPDAAHAWRVRVPDATIGFVDRVHGPFAQDLRREVGDFVVRRIDGDWAYQLAVVVDDAAQGITDVVRGADLLDSTPRQILLQRLLALPDTNWMHVPLVLDASGHKLSKADAARALDDADPLPALRAALAFLGQAVPAHRVPARLLAAATQAFDPARIRRQSGPLRVATRAAMRKD